MDNKGNASSSKGPLDKTGFIQHLSPLKICKGGHKYCTF